MRKTLGRTALLALCVLVASAALAGHITRRGVAQPALQTIFSIDAPAVSATVFGIVEVRGFVLDGRGVSRITLLVDGAPVHDADINQPRPDVRRKYPRFQGEDFPDETGFVTSFLASNYTDGSHTVAIRVTYSNSEVVSLAGIPVIVDNTINQAPIGALDSPGDANAYVSGVYPVSGWVIDAEGIRTTTAPDGKVRADIEVMVDDMVVGQALYPLPRPDVAIAHPDVATAFNSGFQMNLDTTRFTNGMHTISVRVWDTQGMSRVFGSISVWLENNYATLGPFGRIDWPMPNGYILSTVCQYGIPPSGIEYSPGHFNNWISGWALDQNDQQRFEGVKFVELYLDGMFLKRTSTDCQYQPTFRQEVNCYGKERPDILYKYPQFGSDAKNSGFFFAIDGNLLLADPPAGLGVHRGLHYLSVRAGGLDPLRPAVIIDQIPVRVTCNDLGDIAS
ncbi:MAG: Ig-like domain-containing protein, partial [Thermoanaerobaculaceae bacterium]|nr:Ig-like domain-containing protein [Thermoanaerobaculaceae bacterium]